MESILHYFRNYDIKHFDIKNRPITQAYEDMRSSNTHPLYEYLYTVFVWNEYHNEFKGEFRIHKKTNLICIRPEVFRCGFKMFLDGTQQLYIKHDYKTLKLLMADLDIYQKQLRFSGDSPTTYFYFPEISDLEESLKSKGFSPQEVEEA
jgi:hypothetical protein